MAVPPFFYKIILRQKYFCPYHSKEILPRERGENIKSKKIFLSIARGICRFISPSIAV